MWRVVQNSNPRLPKYAVHSVPPGSVAKPDVRVIWEGVAASRQDAWSNAVSSDARLFEVPMPDPFASVDVFERVQPKLSRKERKKAKKAAQIAKAKGKKKEDPTIAEKVYNAIAGEPGGLTCAELETKLELKHQTASPRFNELAHAGCIATTGERRANSEVYAVKDSFDKYSEWRRTTSRPKMSQCMDSIMSFALQRGAEGVTGHELSETFSSLKKGSLESEFSYLKRFRWLVRHPEGLTRPSSKGLATDVFVINEGEEGVLSTIPHDEMDRFRAMAMASTESAHFQTAEPASRRLVANERRSSRNTGRQIRREIQKLLHLRGSEGATTEEVMDHVAGVLEEHFDRGSVNSRLSEMREYGQIIEHPEGVTRLTKKGKPTEVFVLANNALFLWADSNPALRDDPSFAKLFDTLDRMRGGRVSLSTNGVKVGVVGFPPMFTHG